jgi:hypothetical protein
MFSIAYGQQRGSTAPAKAEKLQILAPKPLKKLNRLIGLHDGCAHDVTRGEHSPGSRFSPKSAPSRGVRTTHSASWPDLFRPSTS